MSELETFRSAYLEITTFARSALDVLELDAVSKLVSMLIEAYRRGSKVFVVGVGRSGLVGKAFAMRLVHLGFRAYVLGETITPSVEPGDIVVAISGSGTTTVTVTAADAAKKVGAYVVAITSYKDSPLARIADLVVFIPGRTKTTRINDYFARQILGIHEPLSPLGTLFEITTLIFLDALIAELMKRLGKTEEDLRKVHANVEVFA